MSLVAAGTRIAVNLRRLSQALDASTGALIPCKGSIKIWADSICTAMETHVGSVGTLTANITADLSLLQNSDPPQWDCLFTAKQGMPVPIQSPDDLAAGSRIISQHTVLVASFKKLLTVTLETYEVLNVCLHRNLFDPTPSVTADLADEAKEVQKAVVDAFSLLWRATNTTFTWVCEWLPSDFVPVDATAVIDPVLHKWLTWLLTFLRQDSTLLTAMRQSADIRRDAWQHGPLTILYLVLQQLNIISNTPTPFLLPTMHNIPLGFIDTLCCIVCELCPEPSDVPKPMEARTRTFAIKLVAQLGVFLEKCDFSLGRILPQLIGPAAIQMARLAVIDTCVSNTSTFQDAMTCQLVLNMMMLKSSTKSQPTENASLSPHTMIVPLLMSTDKQLVSAACKKVELQPDWNQMVSVCLECVMGTWDRAHLQEQQLACLPSVARHCLRQLRQWMRQSTSPEAAQRQQQQQQQQQCAVVDILPVVVNEPGPLLDTWIITIENWFIGFLAGNVQGIQNPMSAQGQDAAVTPLPDWRKLQALWSMQGSITLLEAVVRARLTSEHTSHVKSPMMMYMLMQAYHPTPACTEAQVSLAVTFMKLLQIHKLVISPVSPSNTRGQRFDLPYVTSAMDILGGVLISVLAHIHRLENKSKPVCSNPQSSVNSDAVVSEHPNKQRLSKALASGGNSRSGGSNDSSSSSSSSSSATNMLESTNRTSQIHSLRRLSALLLLGLTRSSNILLRAQAKSLGSLNATEHSEPEWLKVLEAHDADLAAVVLQLLLLPFRTKKWLSVKTVRELEPILWGSYSLKYFQGHLLPGCCHLGCTNLAGVSEAALPTLLCSGCRRVRYCSVACQQASWVAGGHGAVCGKGGWAIFKSPG